MAINGWGASFLMKNLGCYLLAGQEQAENMVSNERGNLEERLKRSLNTRK